MKNRTKIAIAVSLLLLVFFLLPDDIQAQCPMCRMTAESNLKNGGTDGRGLNTGILYMLVMPYMLVAAIGIWWWRNRTRPGSGNIEMPELYEKDGSRYN